MSKFKSLAENVNEMVPEDGTYYPSMTLSESQIPDLDSKDVGDTGEMVVKYTVVSKSLKVGRSPELRLELREGKLVSRPQKTKGKEHSPVIESNGMGTSMVAKARGII